MSLHFLSGFSVFLPSCCDSLPLSVELNSTFSVEVAHSPHTVFVSCEGEHRKRYGNWEIYTNLSAFNFMLEFPSCITGSCKDSGTVSIFARINEVHCFLESFSSHNAKNRPENLFVIGSCAWFAVINYCCSNEVSIRVSWNFHSSPIKKYLVFFGGSFNDTFNFLL